MAFLSPSDTVLLALCGGVAFYSIWRSLSSPLRSLPYPPGPAAPRWLSGHLSILPVTRPWKVYTEWAKQYGSVVHFRIYGQHTVVLSSIEDCVEVFERRSNIYSDKPAFTMLELMGWDFNTGLMPYGPRWRRLRRLFQQSFKKVASISYRPEQTRKINDMLHGLLMNSQHFSEHIKTVSGAISMSIAYGYDVEATNDYFIELSEVAVSRLGLAVYPGAALVNAIPMLRHLPPWFPGAGFHKIAAETKEMTTKMQEIPLKWVQKNMEAGTHSDCIVSQQLPSCVTDKDVIVLQEFAGLIYAAGADTTTCALKTYFYAMTLFPKIQRKAQQELDTVVGSHRLPDYNDKESLPYIEAIVREILRWRPVAPLSVYHAVTEDDVLKGYLIPKGCIIIANTWAMTRDERRFLEPEVFNPDRFFNDDGSLNSDDSGYTFGLGRRACPGRHLARETLWLSIATSLWAFNISGSKDAEGDDDPISVEYSDGMVSHPPPFACSITARSPQTKEIIEEAVTLTRDRT